MKKIVCLLFPVVIILLFSSAASAHFGMVIPSDPMVMQGEDTRIRVDLMFWHPFEGHGMDLVKPARFAVMANGKKHSLLDSLKPTRTQGHQTWHANYKVTRPGIYVFYMEPQPYWEPAEDCFIIHYTKAVVAAFGDDEGWDQEVGLKTEIVPLSKPFGLYAGNVLQGIVKMDGKPVPYAEVEVEYYNEDGKVTAPTDYMVTQTIKADGNGIFTYGTPRAGWWGFAALNTAKEPMQYHGVDKDVEMGAVLWVKFYDMN